MADARPGKDSVVLLPVHAGPHVLAIEVVRVLEVHAGDSLVIEDDPDRPTLTCDLRALLDVAPFGPGETIVARADGRLGRGPGPHVAFAVDRAERLLTAPLESFAPLPWVAREQLQVDFIVGTVALPWPAGSIAFLLDPARLAAAAPAPILGGPHG